MFIVYNFVTVCADWRLVHERHVRCASSGAPRHVRLAMCATSGTSSGAPCHVRYSQRKPSPQADSLSPERFLANRNSRREPFITGRFPVA